MTLASWTRHIEIPLLLVGAVLFGVAGLRITQSATFQLQASVGPEHRQAVITGDRKPAAFNFFIGNLHVVGKVSVPRLGMSVFVVEGDDPHRLAIAPGHLPDTSPLGGSGNSVVAGHREMAFRALKDITLGDDIYVQTEQRYTYRVTSLRIVKPDDLSVLTKQRLPMLTLITCYPFHYLGSAPKRFIVQAEMFR